jgi:methylphosphotriester-DNA--protein-cysteine methyltransferase
VRVWELAPAQFMVAGAFRDLAVHRHAAVQVGVGLAGPLSVTSAEGAHHLCRLVVVASGERHAVRSDPRSGALSIYLGPQTRQGTTLNALSRRHGGIWSVDDGEKLATATAESSAASSPCAAADPLLNELCGMSDAGASSVHRQLCQAIDLVSTSMPSPLDLTTAAGAVALSPDYLGRLCKQQTGVSFSATARWMRLLTFLRFLTAGVPITDAAHMAGFTDGSHANRVCWEMAGAAPSDIARALKDSPLAS